MFVKLHSEKRIVLEPQGVHKQQWAGGMQSFGILWCCCSYSWVQAGQGDTDREGTRNTQGGRKEGEKQEMRLAWDFQGLGRESGVISDLTEPSSTAQPS